MAKKKTSYREAIIELEAIVKNIDTGEVDIDQLQEQVARFRELMSECKDKLRMAQADLEKEHLGE
jgi:exodeoxyribonuclease VII small subunit